MNYSLRKFGSAHTAKLSYIIVFVRYSLLTRLHIHGDIDEQFGLNWNHSNLSDDDVLFSSYLYN